MKINIIGLLVIGLQIGSVAQEQRILIDRVIAKVGTEQILLSDVESQYNYAIEQSGFDDPSIKCQIIESLISQKLIVHHAKLDSVEVAEDEIEANLDFRIDQVMRQMNGDEKFFEEYYGMTVKEMRGNLKEDLRQQMLAERMQMTILDEVSITPKEVKEFFRSIPMDSLPYLNAEVELKEIVLKPEINPEEKARSLQKIVDIRKKILSGEDTFENLAMKHSDDPGSGAQGGNLGYATRGSYVPEFEATAYSLEKEEISEPVETEYGYHIMELLDRRGNKIKLRHILIAPETSLDDLERTRIKLDSIRSELQRGEYSFEEGVKRYSDEKIPSRNNNGILQNPNTGKALFQTSELPSEIYFAIEDLDVDDISQPLEYALPTGDTYYRIVKLISKTKPHRANLEQDYAKIQVYAKESKKNVYFNTWLEDKFRSTFIKVEQGCLDCPRLDAIIEQ